MKKILGWLKNFVAPPKTSPGWIRTSTLFFSSLFFLVALTGGAYTWEYTNSPEFCGTGCHSMPPEYTSYLLSPHAEIKCVECHIGRDHIGNQIARKAGDFRHVVAHVSNNYEFPIEIKTLRPAEEVCEQCHNADKFSANTAKQIVRFADDQANTANITFLQLKTGGGSADEGQGTGIHWHTQNEVLFYATDKREQDIPYVKVYDKENEVYVEYVRGDFDVYSLDETQLQKMDCVTCHNRVTHIVPMPEDAVDSLMALNLVSPQIPEIKAKAIELLRAEYASKEEALRTIGNLPSYYQQAYPDFYSNSFDLLQQAAQQLSAFYDQSVFPEAKSDWNTHFNNLGHQTAPGCFRCHDGEHFNEKAEAVPQSCNLCHSVPVQAAATAEVVNLDYYLKAKPTSHAKANWTVLHKYMYDPADENDACSGCHEVANYDKPDNTTFCGNSLCHSGNWETLDIRTLENTTLQAKLILQFPHMPNQIAWLNPWPEVTSLDSIHANQTSQEPILCEDCHNPFPPSTRPSNAQCLTCHGETQAGLQEITGMFEPNPHDQHEGDASCTLCHPNFGPEIRPCALCHEDTPYEQKSGN